jgi:DNA-binding GntR family transcriptional regulator
MPHRRSRVHPLLRRQASTAPPTVEDQSEVPGAVQTATEPEVVTLVDRVYRQLREAVVNGEYPPGMPLRPDRLSRIYDVSLIPIREALRKLEVERLVEATPNKGVRVAAISARDLVDVYATRDVLEVEALRRAGPRLDPIFIGELRELREAMVRANDASQQTRAYELHRRLHFAMYERSDSPWLLHLIDILWNHTERYRRMVARVATFLDGDHDLHGQVLDAFAAGDLDWASQALRLDLGRTRDLVLAANAAELDATGPSERRSGMHPSQRSRDRCVG